MNKILTIILLFAINISLSAQNNFYKHKDESSTIRAVWLTTIGGLDWPHNYARSNASIEKQKNELRGILDKLQRAGINTVLLQTRIRGTVIYPSLIEPWDGCMSGNPGVSPGYDPLQFAIDECHKRNMELHAWVVTIPVGKWNNYGCRNLRKKYPSIIQKIGDDGYMNPEKPQTGDIIASICHEIAKNYDVDGIHLDYIRYPETWNIKVGRERGRQYITDIVRKVNRSVRAVKPNIKISCSPLGKYKDLTRYTSNGWNAFNKGCQDAQRWLREGLMDQLYPMMYFRGNQFYPFAIDWMENCYGKDIVAGLGIYFLDPKEGNWNIGEIKRQMNVARNLGMGICFFRTKFLTDNIQGIYDYLCEEYCYSPLIANINKPTLYDDDLWTRSGLWNNGNVMLMPEKTQEFDANHIIFESFTGQKIATRPYVGQYTNIKDIPEGTYYIRSLNKKGTSHKLGLVIIKRK